MRSLSGPYPGSVLGGGGGGGGGDGFTAVDYLLQAYTREHYILVGCSPQPRHEFS